MAMNLGVIIFVIPAFLLTVFLPVALVVALQVWLCRKSLKLGLILPALSLALSLLLTLSLAGFSTVKGGLTTGGGNLRVTDENGNIIQEEVVEQQIDFHPRTLIAAGAVFLVTNIPTVVFGGIWLHCKGRRDTVEDLKRMQIEDLG